MTVFKDCVHASVSGSTLDLSIPPPPSNPLHGSPERSCCLRLDPLMFHTNIIFVSLGENDSLAKFAASIVLESAVTQEALQFLLIPKLSLCEIEDMSNSKMSNLSLCTSITCKSSIAA